MVRDRSLCHVHIFTSTSLQNNALLEDFYDSSGRSKGPERIQRLRENPTSERSLLLDPGQIRRVRSHPVPGDINAPSHPDVWLAADVINELGQGQSATGPADDATVKANGHHAGPTGSFRVEAVERIAEVREETLPLQGLSKAHVVVVKRVWNDEVGPVPWRSEVCTHPIINSR